MPKFILNPLSGNFDAVLSAASELPYDNVSSGLTATNVQTAVDEVQSNIDALPDPITYQGTYNATTNTPTLSNSDTGVTGYLYQVNVAGTQDFGAGNISFEVGDKVVNNGSIWEKWDMTDSVSSVNSQTGAVVLDADDVGAANQTLSNLGATALNADIEPASDLVTELGAANKRFATLFVRDISAEAGATMSISAETNLVMFTDGDLELQPYNSGEIGLKLYSEGVYVRLVPPVGLASPYTITLPPDDGTSGYVLRTDGSGVTTWVPQAASATNLKQIFTLNGTDISNGYVDLSQVALTDSIDFVFNGLISRESTDYTVSYTGGAGGKTRLTFSAHSPALIAGNVLYIKYQY